MTEEDDWFERALTEEDAGESATGPDDALGEGDEQDGESQAEGADRDGNAPEDEAEVEGTGDASDDDGDLFEDDFVSAFRSAGSPDGSDAAGDFDYGERSGGPFGDDGPFDGSGGDGGPFGGSDFGSGDGSGFDTDEYGIASPDDEEFESDIDRIDLGVEGLDEMIRGGVPARSLMAVIGSAGTGKTTFGLQFLERGLSNDEKTIYVTLEESRERVIRSAEEKGWPFEAYAREGQLAVVDIDPIEMANSLSSIRSELPRLVDRFGATRLVLDSVSLLEMMYDDRATRRNEIYTFARSLKEAGVTVLLTSEASEDNSYASRHGIVEYLTDAVYVLQYVRPSDFRETRLAVEIQKIRDAHHSREMKPYEITDSGISVYQQANIF